jgi:outer membrane scaffolding protein for murein synthesis (MipA/OmpV family)
LPAPQGANAGDDWRLPRRLLAWLAVLVWTSGAPAHAELRPEWEFGLGATGLMLPDYRGSDESRGYLLPFPYLIYRGQRFRVDRQGLRGIFFESDSVEINLSLNATPPVDDDNRTRQGMPHLDPTIEIGPRLDVTLARNREREWSFEVRLPLRAAFATDLSHTRHIGYAAYPHLNLFMRPVLAGVKWNLGVQGGPLFATREYHEYFYAVPPEFATPERSAYEASGGYSGALALVSLSRRFPRVWLGAFARYDILKGAVFEESPLVRRDYAFMAGIAVAWVFAESSKKVEVDVDE